MNFTIIKKITITNKKDFLNTLKVFNLNKEKYIPTLQQTYFIIDYYGLLQLQVQQLPFVQLHEHSDTWLDRCSNCRLDARRESHDSQWGWNLHDRTRIWMLLRMCLLWLLRNRRAVRWRIVEDLASCLSLHFGLPRPRRESNQEMKSNWKTNLR